MQVTHGNSWNLQRHNWQTVWQTMRLWDYEMLNAYMWATIGHDCWIWWCRTHEGKRFARSCERIIATEPSYGCNSRSFPCPGCPHFGGKYHERELSWSSAPASEAQARKPRPWQKVRTYPIGSARQRWMLDAWIILDQHLHPQKISKNAKTGTHSNLISCIYPVAYVKAETSSLRVEHRRPHWWSRPPRTMSAPGRAICGISTITWHWPILAL